MKNIFNIMINFALRFLANTSGNGAPAGVTRYFKKLCEAQPTHVSDDEANATSSAVFMIFFKNLILCFFLSVSSGLQADWSLTDWAKNLFASKQSQAVQAYKSQDYEQGLAHCNDLINSDPYHPEHNYNVGNILYRQKKYQDAQQAFARTVQHVKASSKLVEQAAFNLGNSYYQLEQWQNAVDAYKQALKINEDNQQARHNLQLALEKLRELPENKQSQEDPQNSSSYDKSPADAAADKDNADKNQNSNQDKEGCNDKSSQGQSSDSGEDGNEGDSSGEQSGQQQSKNSSKGTSQSQKNNQDGSQGKDGRGRQEEQDGNNNSDDNQGFQEQGGEDESSGKRDGRDGGLDQGDDSDGFDMNESEDKDSGDNQSSKNSLLNSGKDADDEGDASQQFNQTQGAKENITNNHEQGQAGYAQQGDEHGADDAGGDDNKQAPAFAKKHELKNQLQDLFESKACQDERLTDYHKDVMKTLEDLEEKVQKHIIKNKVAAQGAGKYGKNSW